MRVLVGIKNVDDREFSDSNHDAIGGQAIGKLVQAGIEVRGIAPQIDRLAKEDARNAGIRIGGADLVRFTAEVAGDPKGIAETEPLIDLGIDPNFGAVPGAEAPIKGDIEGLPGLFVRVEAVRPPESRAEPWMVLGDEC